jgi:hypothetical protein
MEQSFLASQEIRRHLGNQVHNRVQKGPPLFPILSQMNPVYIFLPYFPKIHSNIIFPYAPISLEKVAHGRDVVEHRWSSL